MQQFSSIVRTVVFLMLISFMTGCGGNDSTTGDNGFNVSRIEIQGPFDIILGVPIDRPTAGLRASMNVVAYNHAGVLLDPLSGAEVYLAIKWKSSDQSIVEVEEAAANLAFIRFKKSGQAVITASLGGTTATKALVIE